MRHQPLPAPADRPTARDTVLYLIEILGECSMLAKRVNKPLAAYMIDIAKAALHERVELDTLNVPGDQVQ